MEEYGVLSVIPALVYKMAMLCAVSLVSSELKEFTTLLTTQWQATTLRSSATMCTVVELRLSLVTVLVGYIHGDPLPAHMQMTLVWSAHVRLQDIIK